MIYLHTGQPGAGKTLYTVWHVKQWAEKENRPVYYNGIPECKVPGWIELQDPLKWFDCPPNSIIILDEAQRVFRTRGTGATVPEHVAKLETHRHLGIDLVIITQHPMLIDSNVRRLTGTHKHVMRAFGAAYAVVHEWSQVKEQCDKTRGDSLKTQFAYPKEAFGLYKSAEVHTHKRKLPWRMFILIVIPFGLIFSAAGFYSWWSKSKEGAPGLVSPAKGNLPGQTAPLNTIMTQEAYLKQAEPRLSSLQHTAPVYDALTKPKRVPVPSACVSTATRCKCYTQDATPYQMDESVCRQIVAGGMFYAFDPSGPDVQNRRVGRIDDARGVETRRPADSSPPSRGFPENDNFIGVSNPGSVLAYDKQQGGNMARSDAIAGPVINQAQGIGRGRVLQ
jgi:zona occludens toxin